jgi:ketosteroid isomerase-like protein
MTVTTKAAEDKKEVWTFVRALNDAWTKEKGERLTEYFHPRMVAITPVDKYRLKGSARCIAGWQGFSQGSTIHSWREDEPDIELFGDTAVVTYYYEMDVTIGTSRMNLTGRDLLVLQKEHGRWWLIADQFSGYPGNAEA